MAKPSPQRRRERVVLPGTLEGSIGIEGRVRIINLSPTGAMIEHAGRLYPSQNCVIGMRLSGAELRLRAQVVWSQVHSANGRLPGEGAIQFRSGLHFPNLPESTEAKILEFLAALSPPKPDAAPGQV